MTRFDGIKKAKVKVTENSYGAKKQSKGNRLFLRIIVAMCLVIGVMAVSALFHTDASQPFKQDYAEQYEKD